uniref:Uncharacterized protein n=1 Tax=Solanum tuberosum TaxID=4113 RepID=M1DZH0_SOLTU
MDRQSTNGPLVSSINGPVNFQSSVANDSRPLRTVSRLTSHQSVPAMGKSTFRTLSKRTADQYRVFVDSRPVSQLLANNVGPVWINGPSVSSIDGPVNFQSLLVNDVDQYGPSVDSRPASQLRRWASQLSVLSRERQSTSTERQSTHGQFRFSASRSRVDRFPISSSAASVCAHSSEGPRLVDKLTARVDPRGQCLSLKNLNSQVQGRVHGR